jgi:hypothetical protein
MTVFFIWLGKKTCTRHVNTKADPRQGHVKMISDAERLAVIGRRIREHAARLKAQRPTSIFLKDGPPPMKDAQVTARKCQARTLTGKPCGFKATCGLFCSKHQVKS